MSFQFDNDPSILLSNGWLTKGQVGAIIGQTGVGKSSFGMQIGVNMAIGQNTFGIAPTRPLKVVIIQGENTDRICARELQGVAANVPGVAGHEDEIKKNLAIYKVSCFSGNAFIRFLRCVIIEDAPDILILDPWFSFLGGAVNSQEVVSPWLRNGLQPLCDEFGTSVLIVHHTTKPARDARSKLAYSGGDWAYFGAGSAEFANFCRVILTLREDGADLYELRAAKNQEHWPLTESDEPDAKTTNVIYLQRGEGAIYWRRADQSALSAIDGTNSAEINEVLEALKTPPADGRGWRYSGIISEIIKIRGGKQAGAKSWFRRNLLTQLSESSGIYALKGFKVS